MRALSKHITAMPRSGIGGIMDIAERLQGVVHLEVGEPHLATPPHIVAAAIRALQDGFTRYTPSAGLPSLRVLLAEKLRARNRISASPESVAVTPGGVFASAVALLTVAGAGDEVLLPDPGWPNYGLQTMAVGIRRVPYHLRPGRGFLPDLDEISRLITGRTRAIFVNSPSNPTGAVFPEAVLAAILELARARDLYVIADEAYEDMVFEGHHHSLGSWDTEGRVITLYTLSKSYAMTGWRVGYVSATADLCEQFSKLSEAMVLCVSTPSQKAAEAAIAGPQSHIAAMVEAYRRSRDVLLGILSDEGVPVYKPAGAFYALVDVSASGVDAHAFTHSLLAAERVAVAPGPPFGEIAAPFVRVSFCKDEATVAEGAQRLARHYRTLVNHTR